MKNKTPKLEEHSIKSNVFYLLQIISQKNPKLLFLLLVSGVTSTAMWYLWSYWGKFLIQIVMDNKNQIDAGIKQVFVLTLLFSIIIFVFLFANSFVMAHYNNQVIPIRTYFSRLRLIKTMELDYQKLETTAVLDLMRKAERATDDKNAGIQGMIASFRNFLQMFFTLAIATIIISAFNPWLLFIGACAACIQSWNYNKAIEYENIHTWTKMGAVLRKLNYLKDITCDFSYGKDIRLYGMKDGLLHKQKEVNRERYHLISMAKNRWNWNALFGQAVTFVLNFIMYGFVIWSIIHQKITVAEFYFYVASVVAFSANVKDFLDSISDFCKYSRQMQDYRLFMEIENTDTGDKALPETEHYRFDFCNVSFRYPGSTQYVIKNLYLTLDSEKRTAIVGDNGSGKSTLVKLLLRIYDVTEGVILLNGTDIRCYNRKKYFLLFAPVFQNSELFAFSLGENIAMRTWKEEFREDVEKCLDHSGFKQKRTELTKGIDTQLLKVFDEEGTDLSGGERQKVALARALYKEAPVMVLDEPTAALDPIAEYEMYKNFDNLLGKKTAVYISHRLSSTQFCDVIALIHDGKAAEFGTHKELINKDGLYAKMYKIQGQYYQEDFKENQDINKLEAACKD